MKLQIAIKPWYRRLWNSIRWDYNEFWVTDIPMRNESWWHGHTKLWHYTRWPRYIYLVTIYYGWRRWMPYTICKVFGHKWEDDSYGGPEFGYIGVHCKRCGEGHRETLY